MRFVMDDDGEDDDCAVGECEMQLNVTSQASQDFVFSWQPSAVTVAPPLPSEVAGLHEGTGLTHAQGAEQDKGDTAACAQPASQRLATSTAAVHPTTMSLERGATTSASPSGRGDAAAAPAAAVPEAALFDPAALAACAIGISGHEAPRISPIRTTTAQQQPATQTRCAASQSCDANVASMVTVTSASMNQGPAAANMGQVPATGSMGHAPAAAASTPISSGTATTAAAVSSSFLSGPATVTALHGRLPGPAAAPTACAAHIVSALALPVFSGAPPPRAHQQAQSVGVHSTLGIFPATAQADLPPMTLLEQQVAALSFEGHLRGTVGQAGKKQRRRLGQEALRLGMARLEDTELRTHLLTAVSTVLAVAQHRLHDSILHKQLSAYYHTFARQWRVVAGGAPQLSGAQDEFELALDALSSAGQVSRIGADCCFGQPRVVLTSAGVAAVAALAAANAHAPAPWQDKRDRRMRAAVLTRVQALVEERGAGAAAAAAATSAVVGPAAAAPLAGIDLAGQLLLCCLAAACSCSGLVQSDLQLCFDSLVPPMSRHFHGGTRLPVMLAHLVRDGQVVVNHMPQMGKRYQCIAVPANNDAAAAFAALLAWQQPPPEPKHAEHKAARVSVGGVLAVLPAVTSTGRDCAAGKTGVKREAGCVHDMQRASKAPRIADTGDVILAADDVPPGSPARHHDVSIVPAADVGAFDLQTERVSSHACASSSAPTPACAAAAAAAAAAALSPARTRGVVSSHACASTSALSPAYAAAALSPAARAQGVVDPSLLHFEILSFAADASPTEQELERLVLAVTAVGVAARSIWPQSRAALFGSQASGLALPSSDLDIVVLGVCDKLAAQGSAEGFDKVAQGTALGLLGPLTSQLRSAGVITRHQIIRAKVPIVKTRIANLAAVAGRGGGATSALSNQLPAVQADISIGLTNGVEAVALIQHAVQAVPALRPLCLVLKALLKEAGLNEVFTGGISSYTLVNMVIAHLQCEGVDACSSIAAAARPPPTAAAAAAASVTAVEPEQLSFLRSLSNRVAGCQDMDLGVMLKRFLWRFGEVFNYHEQAISINGGGVVRKPDSWRISSGERLSVEDPQLSGRDIGCGSFNIQTVRQVCKAALHALERAEQRLLHAGNEQVVGLHQPSGCGNHTVLDSILDVSLALLRDGSADRHRARASPRLWQEAHGLLDAAGTTTAPPRPALTRKKLKGKKGARLSAQVAAHALKPAPLTLKLRVAGPRSNASKSRQLAPRRFQVSWEDEESDGHAPFVGKMKRRKGGQNGPNGAAARKETSRRKASAKKGTASPDGREGKGAGGGKKGAGAKTFDNEGSCGTQRGGAGGGKRKAWSGGRAAGDGGGGAGRKRHKGGWVAV